MTHTIIRTSAAFGLAAMVMFSSFSPVLAESKKVEAPGQVKKIVTQSVPNQVINMPELPEQASEVAQTKMAEILAEANTKQNSNSVTDNQAKKDSISTENKQSIHGSNGTVKVGDYVLGNGPDGNPGNKSHLPCKFQIEAYGFDAGVNKVNYVVTTQAPTKPKGEVVASGSFNLDIDTNAYGASDRGFDGKVVLDLSNALSKYSAHEKQGYHVKVEVTFEGQPSNSGKHKVFWIEECATTVAPTPTPGQTLSTNTSNPDTAVKGESIERGSTLPYTGGNGLVVAQAFGMFLVALGGVIAWGKRVAAQCSY